MHIVLILLTVEVSPDPGEPDFVLKSHGPSYRKI